MSYPSKTVLFSILVSLFFISTVKASAEEKKEAAPVPSSEAVDKQFSQGLLKIQNLSVRQEDYRNQLEALTQQRKKASSKAQQQALRSQMVEIEKTQKKEQKELEELKVQIQYRYPDFGEKKKREYAAPEGRKPAAEPETDSLSDVLMSTKRAMEEQYPTDAPQKKKAVVPPPKAGGGKSH